MKEIGSIFALKASQINNTEYNNSILFKDRLQYSLCREAFYHIALVNSKSNKTVLLPAYTCATVITPFKEAGWKIDFYSIDTNLRIDTNYLIEKFNKLIPEIIVVHPYFGMDLNNEEDAVLSLLKAKGAKIVIDLTQCIFSVKSYQYSDYIVGSYRKWFPIPDGAFLMSKGGNIKQTDIEFTHFTKYVSWAMYLRGEYFRTKEQLMKEISIALSKKADRISAENISIHCMSKLSLGILEREDVKSNQNKRYSNFSYLYRTIKNRNEVRKVCNDLSDVTTAPLYFSIYVKNRDELQHTLADNSIYAPIIWPVEDRRVLSILPSSYIYDHILSIPCDQRYDEQDMSRVANLINHFEYEK